MELMIASGRVLGAIFIYAYWTDISIGTSVARLGITMIQKRAENGVELYIPDDKNVFKSLLEKKDSIEKETGFTFDWQELPTKKGSRVIVTNPADFDDSSKWPEQVEWIMDALLKMKKTFKKYL